MARTILQCYTLVLFGLCLPHINHASPRITALILEDLSSATIENGIKKIGAGSDTLSRLVGERFSKAMSISFTTSKSALGSSCDDHRSTNTFKVNDLSPETGLVNLNFQVANVRDDIYYLCLREANSSSGINWIHQGTDSWMGVQVVVIQSTMLPIWLQVILICLLLCMSGLFSGLNLGLMSLDKNDLKIIQNCGSPSERKYAKTIYPIRCRGNFLLCTILLGNVLVNNSLTILMDDLTGSGIFAVLSSTAGIVIFGEIIPQAVCSRHGLAIGARTIWITKFFMLFTFPISYPISKILDWVLGEEIGNVYNRDRLRELFKVTGSNLDLEKDEMNIITGALELSKKTVEHVMTKLDDVFMIDYNSTLNFKTMSSILKTGYTRVPVYEKERSNVVALLNIKDLALLDPDDCSTLKSVCQYFNHPLKFVFSDHRLDKMLEEFKKGRSHISFVQRVNNEGEGDPFYEIIGIVTLEDVIEEIIQSEIVDETDTVMDNRKKAPRKGQNVDLSWYRDSLASEEKELSQITPQQAMATYQFLSTSVTAFKSEYISQAVLQRLIRRRVVLEELTEEDLNSPRAFIYTRGKVCDYFVLILQGRIEVNIGKDCMNFESGPYTYFGSQVLTSSVSANQSVSSLTSIGEGGLTKSFLPYIPDFTVTAISPVQFLKINRSDYMKALHTTLMERDPKEDNHSSHHGESSDTLTDEKSPVNQPLISDAMKDDQDES